MKKPNVTFLAHFSPDCEEPFRVVGPVAAFDMIGVGVVCLLCRQPFQLRPITPETFGEMRDQIR